MRNYNGYGSITKLKGNRRRPWMCRITTGWELDENNKAKQVEKVLGYYGSRQEALKALADYNDDPFDMDNFKVTFDQCYQQIHKDFSPNRVRNYESAYKYLNPIKDKPIRQIKAAMMQKCIDDCTTTQQGDILSLCHKIFDYALYNEITDKNPSLHLHKESRKDSKERNIFTSDEIRFIELNDTWWKNILCCLLYSGMRGKELRTLTKEDINLDDMTINIRQAKNKTSVRIIPIHTHAEGYFRQYKEEGINFYGHAYNTFNKAIVDSFSVEHHGHDTRHTFTSRIRECGADQLIIQRLLGHAPETITQKVYTHISLEEMRSNLELLRY